MLVWEFVRAPSGVREYWRYARQASVRTNGEAYYFPIHHLVAVREELLQREPWLALNLVDAFTEAKRRAAHYYDEACFTSLVWGRLSLEAEADFFGGADPWPYGLAANRKNIALERRRTEPCLVFEAHRKKNASMRNVEV